MNIKSLKTGKYALHHAWGPVIEVIEDEIIDFDLNEDQIKILINYGVIDPNYIDKDDGEEDSDIDPDDLKDKDTESVLKDLIEVMDDPEAKSALQDWGQLNFGIKVSKSKNIENMIYEIVENSNSSNEEDLEE